TVIGEGDEEVIFITDPLCPYCRNTLPAIEQLSKMGVKVYVVAVPLHGERSVKIVKGVICEGKSVQDLHTYTPPEDFASCEKADKIVEDSLKFFAKAGVGGTPAIVSARSGAVQLGMVRSAEDIIQILNLQSSAADNKGKESKESKSKEDEKDKTSEKIESLLKKHD
ncbi:MAG: thioredoxin fold domain-containing protein, partial [Nitrososphaerota archaeon]